MNVRFTVRNVEKVKAFIESLPQGVKVTAMKAFSEYIVGDENHGLKHEPAEKFVSRADAYGKVSDAPEGYFSWKQFRYVAAITEGFTKAYTRTHELVSAWTVDVKDSNWTQVHISNDADGAQWAFSNQQARQLGLVGWRKYMAVVASNTAGGLRHALAAVNMFLKAKGK